MKNLLPVVAVGVVPVAATFLWHVYAHRASTKDSRAAVEARASGAANTDAVMPLGTPESAARSGTASPSESPSDDPMRWQREADARFAEQLKLLGNELRNQPRDPEWSEGASRQLSTSIVAHLPKDASAQVECASTICRVTVNAKSREGVVAAITAARRAVQWNVPSLFYAEATGPFVGYGYVPREGHRLPDVAL